MRFREKLDAAVARNQSLLCVGLDPQPELMPVKSVASRRKGLTLAAEAATIVLVPAGTHAG